MKTPKKHHNNTTIPETNSDIYLELATKESKLSLEDLMTKYPQSVIEAYTYVTNHGVHGPYRLEGVSLLDLIPEMFAAWSSVEVISADGFANTLSKAELLAAKEPAMLYYLSDGKSLEPKHGPIRLVVPSETNNAIRQIKWVKRIQFS
jgi:DMSO/TMAO reductase YedYZ molybdopterin-dependent catalytic subunit